MKKAFIIILMFVCLLTYGNAKEIIFPYYDGSFEYFPMKQFDDLYLSGYKLLTDLFYENNVASTYVPKFTETFKERWANVPKFIPYLGLFLIDNFLMGITHEEAHRSILTAKGIGSVSQPVIKFKSIALGMAYIKGVSDESLKNLRDTDFSNFIRLHTAGNESDYCLSQKEYSKIVFEYGYSDLFNCSTFLNGLYIEYFTRLFSMVMYESSASSGGIDNMVEETNELDRDIVGDDICGMIHHLYHPDAEYHRYFSAKDFTSEEKKFAKRIAWKTLMNIPFISPIWFNTFAFNIKDTVNLSFNTGYCLAPFGDFIDENIYVQIPKVLAGPLNMSLTMRQYQNKTYWFPEFVFQCNEFSPLNFLTLNAQFNLWWQPKDFSFTTSKKDFGGAVSLGCNIYPFKQNEGAKYNFGFNLNFLYKSEGFMLEINPLDQSFIFTCGLAVKY